ncbi:MAG: PAS domain S-box protein [Prolixibacteraceae bacterium]|nr:PAS domain S-box protein [Prolixibacteraceae bacterium]
MVYDDDREQTSLEMKKLFTPPHTCYIEQRAYTTKGWRWLSWSDTAVLDENNNVVSIIGVGHDIHEKKIAKDKAKSLSKIVEETHDEIYVFDLDSYNFIYLNHSAMNNLGYSAGEIAQMNPVDIKPEITPEEFQTLINPLLEGTESSIGFETVHKRKNGSLYPVEVHLQVIEYEGQKAFCAFIRDISKRKEASEQVVKTNLLLRTIIDNLPDAIYMKDTEARKVLANRADVENCGCESEEQLLGKNDFDLFPQELAQHFWDDDQKVLNDGISVINREEILTNRFGQTKILLSSKVPLKDSDGNIIGLIGIGKDVTREKEAESEMIKLARAVSQSPVSIVITTPDGRIEYVNPKFTQVSGYSFEEVLGKNPRILKSGQHDKEFYQEMWKKLKAGEDWQGELLNRKKNGELLWESAIISPIVDDNGNTSYFVGVKEDITEKKKMMKELIMAKDRAEESDQLKSSFLANMSHEIRTPLNSILGFSNFLASEENLTEEEKSNFSAIINKSADSLLQIINDIIDISSLETGQLQIFPVQLKISPILKSLHTVFSRKKLEMSKANIEIKVTDIPHILIYADENRLIQVFTNLLNNSLKFTKNGTIEFGIEKAGDEFVTMFVSDTGIGIKAEYHHSVFERFRQGETSKNREFGGNGLGLSIVKNLVELMGGKIWLESEVDKGSIFRFTLPVH